MEITFEVLNIKIIPLFISILALIGLINTTVLIVPVVKYTLNLVDLVRNHFWILSFTQFSTTTTTTTGKCRWIFTRKLDEISIYNLNTARCRHTHTLTFTQLDLFPFIVIDNSY